MSWSRDEVTILIEEYQKWPNLYAVRSPNYKNRNLRTNALASIKSVFKDMKANVTTSEIQSKFQSLKQNAIKEYKKWQNSLKSGAGEDEVMQPSLWYFDLISFVFDHSIPRQATDSMETISQFTPTTEDSQDIDNLELHEEEMVEAGCEIINEEVIEHDGMVMSDGWISPEPQVVASSSACQMSKRRSSSLRNSHSPVSTKKKQRIGETQLLQTVSGSLQNISANLLRASTPTSSQIPQKRTANDHFGDFVVQKLNRITVDEVRDETELEILKTLNAAIRQCRQ